MTRPLPILLLAWLILPGLLPRATAQDATPPHATDFRAYSLITERNIFNPNRFRRSENSPPPEEARRQAEPDHLEFFTLLGTLSYPKGCYAYFNGSQSDFQKTVRPQESIGDHKVLEITPSKVLLEHEGKTVTLNVGMQLKRQNQGPWELVSQPLPSPDRGGFSRSGQSSNSTSSRTGPATAPPPEPVNEDDEILKRLMEKREQELKNENK